MSERKTALLLSLALLFCYAYIFPRWADWNQNSRLDLTLAIVEQGTFAIDDYYTNTGDYAVYGGHIYTDKAPGTSFLAVPVYFAFRQVADTPPARALLKRLSSTEALAATLREGGTGLLEEKVYFAAALYVATFTTVSLPSALLGGLLYLSLGRILESRRRRVVLVLAYGLATVVFPYSSVFYGHQIAAVFLFAAFVLLYRMRRGELGLGWLWAVGGLMGLAVLVEFPALFPTAGLGLYALWFLRERLGTANRRGLVAALARVGLAGLPFALLLGYYNNACFGSPFTSSYKYLGKFPEISNTGFLGFSKPSLEALWGITFSPYRGLFFMSPFLLLALPGFWYGLRDRRWRAEAVLLLGIVLAQFGLISAWYDWRGGFALGPRNLLITLPFLSVAIAFALRSWQGRGLALTGGLMLLSFGITWVISVSGQELAPITIANPLVDFFWPKFARGDIARNLGMALGLKSWASLILPLLVIGGTLWITCRNAPLGGTVAGRPLRREASPSASP